MMEEVPRAGGGLALCPWATMIIREIYTRERAGGNRREVKKVFCEQVRWLSS